MELGWAEKAGAPTLEGVGVPADKGAGARPPFSWMQ